ncbi:MAG: hypothetical protein NZ521_06595, partial [Flammeovirgaceae bacterium]|nr:hypothetical protein [Flammeovirgaceae bacterium]MDW8287893.1 hypothetical protein [Flammeovirgaceae bacterium]
ASEKSRWFLLKRWLYRIHAIPKKVRQHPLTADVAALIAPFSLVFLFLAFITVAYHRHLAVFLQQLNRISPFYTTWSSIYDLIIGLALLGCLSTINLIIPSWKILPSRKRKKYHLIALTCFFGLPCWFVGKIYSPSWWNETHYQKLSFKTWMFLEPFFVALPLVILQAYAVGWFNVRLQRQRTAIKKWRKKKSLIA